MSCGKLQIELKILCEVDHQPIQIQPMPRVNVVNGQTFKCSINFVITPIMDYDKAEYVSYLLTLAPISNSHCSLCRKFNYYAEMTFKILIQHLSVSAFLITYQIKDNIK